MGIFTCLFPGLELLSYNSRQTHANFSKYLDGKMPSLQGKLHTYRANLNFVEGESVLWSSLAQRKKLLEAILVTLSVTRKHASPQHSRTSVMLVFMNTCQQPGHCVLDSLKFPCIRSVSWSCLCPYFSLKSWYLHTIKSATQSAEIFQVKACPPPSKKNGSPPEIRVSSVCKIPKQDDDVYVECIWECGVILVSQQAVALCLHLPLR